MDDDEWEWEIAAARARAVAQELKANRPSPPPSTISQVATNPQIELPRDLLRLPPLT